MWERACSSLAAIALVSFIKEGRYVASGMRWPIDAPKCQHCVVGISPRSGTRVKLSVSAAGSTSMPAADDRWRARRSEVFPVESKPILITAATPITGRPHAEPGGQNSSMPLPPCVLDAEALRRREMGYPRCLGSQRPTSRCLSSHTRSMFPAALAQCASVAFDKATRCCAGTLYGSVKS